MPDRLANRVLIIGWDAADWRVIRPLMDDGKMPALKRLVDAGAWGNLATLQPAMSPMLWTSIATGKRADRHGIHGFLEPEPDGTGVRPVSSTSRAGKALWNVAHQNGLKTLSVGWYASHPAEPVAGAVVSDRFFAPLATPDDRPPAGSVHPEGLYDELAELRVRVGEIEPTDLAAFIPRFPELGKDEREPLGALAGILAKNASVQAVATRLMLDDDWDLATVFFDGLDHLGHSFMPYHPPRREGVDERKYELFSGVMAGAYRFFDMMLSALLTHAGGDATVLLVSDHGFKSDHLRPAGEGWDSPVGWHRTLGVAVASGPGVRAGGRVYAASVLDVAPTALHLLGVPAGSDMEGRAWAEVTTSDARPGIGPSWDEVPGDAGLHPADLRQDPADAVAAMQQLVDLGYVAPMTGDAEETVKRTLRDNRINLVLSMLDCRSGAAVSAVVDGLVADWPDDPLVAFIAAQAALSRGDPSAAAGLIDRAESAGGEASTVRSLRAEAAMAGGRFDEAADHYRRVLDEGPGAPNALASHCRLGDALEKLGDPAGARRAFLDALAVDPDHAPAWYGVARLELDAGDAESAVAHATHAVSLIHVFPKGHYLLGRALLAAGRREDAAVAWEVCAGLAPGFGPVVRQLADLKESLGHADARRYRARSDALRARRRGRAAGNDWVAGAAKARQDTAGVSHGD